MSGVSLLVLRAGSYRIRSSGVLTGALLFCRNLMICSSPFVSTGCWVLSSWALNSSVPLPPNQKRGVEFRNYPDSTSPW